MRQKDIERLADIFENEARFATADEAPGIIAMAGAIDRDVHYTNPELDLSRLASVIRSLTARKD